MRHNAGLIFNGFRYKGIYLNAIKGIYENLYKYIHIHVYNIETNVYMYTLIKA